LLTLLLPLPLLLLLLLLLPDTGGVKKGRLTDDHGTSGQAVLSFVANTSKHLNHMRTQPYLLAAPATSPFAAFSSLRVHTRLP
jgi:hypothetical protein